MNHKIRAHSCWDPARREVIELAEQMKMIEVDADLPTGVIVGSAVIQTVEAVNAEPRWNHNDRSARPVRLYVESTPFPRPGRAERDWGGGRGKLVGGDRSRSIGAGLASARTAAGSSPATRGSWNKSEQPPDRWSFHQIESTIEESLHEQRSCFIRFRFSRLRRHRCVEEEARCLPAHRFVEAALVLRQHRWRNLIAHRSIAISADPVDRA